MQILPIVPARKGSKRIPNKNMKVLGGKPLIVWTLDQCKGLPTKTALVSTDDPTIQELVIQNGFVAPWLRPQELSTDESTTLNVLIHALDYYQSIGETIDAVLLLQPTSPFRTKESILRAIDLFLENDGLHTVVGVSKADPHPMWCFEKNGIFLKPLFNGEGFLLRSQDLPEMYSINGAIYLIPVKTLYEKRAILSERNLPIVIDSQKETLDIDTMEDWQYAEFLCEQNSKKPDSVF
ncbi:acylneuraminate cytidylyltransferase family protein [Leptospira sp. 201903075]|nr:acylneuraminate cytidylyltransferase family protein [Leptospira chreensis]